MNSGREQKQDTKKKTVIIGMNGSIDSTMTAYLLNKQNYRCIGVCVVFIDSNDEKQVYGSCNKHDLDQAKKICQELSMPFYAVNARDVYKAEVVDFVVSSRLQGEKFSHCICCTNLLIDTLIEKTELLGADYVATGHYAKVNYNKDSKEYTLHASSDLSDDQSYLMSTLTEKQLKKMILPLGDMRKKEVIKISKLLNYKFKDTNRKTFCFENDQKVIELVEASSTENFWESGDIISIDKNDVLGEHQGLYKFKHGQHKFTGEDEGALKNRKVVGLDPDQKKVFVDREKGHFIDFCEVSHFKPVNKMDISKPMKAYAQWGMNHDKHFCTIHFKSSGHALIKFEEKKEGPIGRGVIVSLFNKNARNAQLLGSGKCVEAGIYEIIDRLEGQLDEDERVEYEEDRKVRNIDEYKF